MFPLWSWPAAMVLLLLGIAAGGILLPFLWPMRRQQSMRMPVGILAFMALVVPSLFFLFVAVLRTAEQRVAPLTTWSQWVVFAVGLSIGLWIEERRHG